MLDRAALRCKVPGCPFPAHWTEEQLCLEHILHPSWDPLAPVGGDDPTSAKSAESVEDEDDEPEALSVDRVSPGETALVDATTSRAATKRPKNQTPKE